jgi:hypothetical protein
MRFLNVENPNPSGPNTRPKMNFKEQRLYFINNTFVKIILPLFKFCFTKFLEKKIITKNEKNGNLVLVALVTC